MGMQADFASPPDAASELELLLAYLPETVRRLIDPSLLDRLVEVVMDLGRPAQLRLPGDFSLLPHTVRTEDLEYVVQRVGAFRSDNRVGVEGTLHRISAIRNRYQDLVGVTIRIGRHLPGVGAPLRPWLQGEENLLILGPPGSGKTTLLRDLTRVASTELRRRVVVVDTSNEIGGDGNVPHPSIGTARRIQVPSRADQYRLLLEAVQNHTPEVVVIDEIGTKEEAATAASIAERGIQLIATAHGRTLRNLIKNAELNLLAGGVHTVSYGAATAALGGIVGARGAGRMSAQERVREPTFQSVVELVADAERTLRVYETAGAVDALLDGLDPPSPIFLTPTLGQTLDTIFSDPETIRRYGDSVDWYREMLNDRKADAEPPDPLHPEDPKPLPKDPGDPDQSPEA
ncbi:MAG: AAA family ATPase [Armatimonadetes bacterium]|nr:AAA family ATPase [Armatimonadota bacterium]